MAKAVFQKEVILRGAEQRPFSLDYTLLPDGTSKPILIFCHGFKGFKDWGHWNAVARFFAEHGYCFVKFNFSHNGTTPDSPRDFVDLEAFGRNTYSKELCDLEAVIDWVSQADKHLPKGEVNPHHLALIGHSRGGGIALLQAAKDQRIKALCTWASVAALDYSWQDANRIKTWKEEGLIYAFNARTKQQMPLYFSLYQDFQQHQEEYNLCRAAASLPIPHLIIHGSQDSAVPVDAALQLKTCNPKAELIVIEKADHVFGGRHPWTTDGLPPQTQQVVEHFLKFWHP